MEDSGSRMLVTGATGMVGSALVDAARRAGLAVATTGRRPEAGAATHFQWDIGADDPPESIAHWRPQYVVHAAAWTDVDACESDPVTARAVNVEGTRRVASLAHETGARLTYLSTDSVFDGRTGSYRDDDHPNPLNVYAATKRDGETIALRTARSLVIRFNVIGPARLSWWILTSASRGTPVHVYSDVRFNPIDVRDLAPVIIALTLSDTGGICHLAGDEVVSKAEFAARLAAAAGLSTRAAFHVTRLADRQPRALRPLDTSLRISERVNAIVSPPALERAIQRLAREFVTERV